MPGLIVVIRLEKPDYQLWQRYRTLIPYEPQLKLTPTTATLLNIDRERTGFGFGTHSMHITYDYRLAPISNTTVASYYEEKLPPMGWRRDKSDALLVPSPTIASMSFVRPGKYGDNLYYEVNYDSNSRELELTLVSLQD